MSLEGIGADDIQNILSSLSNEDIENLKNMAEGLFGSGAEGEKKQEASPFSSFDFSSVSKIASLMSLFSSPISDPRCELLYALKPLISEDKRPKIDQAVKMLQIMALLPKLKEMNILNLF